MRKGWGSAGEGRHCFSCKELWPMDRGVCPPAREIGLRYRGRSVERRGGELLALEKRGRQGGRRRGLQKWLWAPGGKRQGAAASLQTDGNCPGKDLKTSAPSGGKTAQSFEGLLRDDRLRGDEGGAPKNAANRFPHIGRQGRSGDSKHAAAVGKNLEEDPGAGPAQQRAELAVYTRRNVLRHCRTSC